MNAKRVIPTLTVAAACTLGAVPVASARAADVQQASSGNWSGYVVGSSSQEKTFRSVTGSWVQPSADCSAQTGSTYAAFWVGLGGADSKQALEQDGTEVNCSADGTATYYAWYELVPKAPVKVDLAVHAGDHMTATTTVNGHAVTETIVNHTTGQTFAKTLTMSDPDTSSAEWIAEAPSQCEGSLQNCSTLTLSKFGTVNFTDASATDSSGHTGPISDSSWQTAALTLSPSANALDGSSSGIGYGYGGGGSAYGAQATSGSSGGATPSSLSSNGSAFTVSYRDETASSTTGTSGYGSSSSGAGDGSGSGDGYGSSGYGSSGGYGGYGGYGGGYGTSGYGGYGSAGYGYGTDGGYIIISAY